MRFAHLADVHIGAWRDPLMKNLSLEAFRRAITVILEKKLDFVIIAGDLFNTAVPAIDHLQETVILLKKLKQAHIPVYVVPGSHDYSASGKTILDVLEETELLKNVMKGEVIEGKLKLSFTEDPKTKAKLTGIGGRKGSLEQEEYDSLDIEPLEQALGPKIFLFHTTVEELLPTEMKVIRGISASEFPRGFDYYAGGHIHIVEAKDLAERKNVVYPGPIFPANFSEAWSLGKGGFYIYEDGELEYQPLNVKSVYRIEADAQNKTPEEVYHELDSAIKLKEFNNAIVLVKVHGELKSGKPSDIDFKSFVKSLYNKGAFFVMRSTSKLTSKEFTEMIVHSGTAEELEAELIQKHAAKQDASRYSGDQKKEEKLIRELLRLLSDEQKDGEKKYEYEARMKKETDHLLSS